MSEVHSEEAKNGFLPGAGFQICSIIRLISGHSIFAEQIFHC
ncbi:hypothetical protein HMPREF1508_1981 [Shuttleworthella sp. MSX8B]|uniref:Uncharacterized protein n=1 Tax=Shuttleworthella satelles DSM 14600 TaxID=626523 RepID=C4G8P1_9FIRM|nr:hypothetical protein GCWU000342_00338 [Shuttleworthia satelles DSM 14600]EUB13809.1 hypothetical protein HMPREF1508_1981 [Shuttleworthia sp. MSX8B]